MITRARGQITLIDVTDAYAANLSVQAYTFIGNGSTPLGVLSQQSFSVKITGLRGAEAVAAAVNISALTLPTGLTVTSDNHLTAPTLTFTATTSLTVTTLAAVGNMVTLPVVLDGGKVTLNRAISLQIAPTGIGVDELVTQYYLSTSNTTQTGGSWSATPAAYVAGRYYWKRNKVDWTDGTTSYTDPVLDNALTNANATALEANQKVDDLEIGGRNIIVNTMNPVATPTNSRPRLRESAIGCTGRGACTTAEHGLRFTINTDNVGNWQYFRFGSSNTASVNSHLMGLKPGEDYTYSFDVEYKLLSGRTETSTDLKLEAQLWTTPGTSTQFGRTVYQTIHEYKASDLTDRGVVLSGHVDFTFTIPDNATRLYLDVKMSNTNIKDDYLEGDYIELSNIMLVRGNKAADWQPAPEDVDESISAVETIANNAMTAANGKNTIYHQSTQPTGTFTEGDTWFDTANDYAMYTWDGTAWTLEQFGEDSIAAGAIKAGHIDAGAVTADKIAANAVTAKKMAIGDFTNLATVSENNPATMQTEYVNGATSISNGYIVKADRSKNYLMLNSNRTPSSFRTGDELYFEFTAHASEALSTFFKVYAYTSANTNISQLLSVSSALNIGTSDSKITGSVVLTTSNSSYQWESHAVTYFICLNENFANKDIYVKDVIVRKKNGGELIVDGAITADKIAANAITAAMISGKDITGGTLKTTLGPQGAISQNLGGGLTILDVADPNMCHIQLYNQGLRVVPANSDSAITRLLQVMFADFDGVGIQYGWAVTTAFFSPKIYNAGGRVLGRNDMLAYEEYSAGETGNMVTGVPGVTAIYRREAGVVTLSFANFSFAAGTGTDSTNYQLIPDLWPLKEMDLVSTLNGTRFRITTTGYIRPFTAVSSQTTIRGTFTYLTLGGDAIVVG